MKILRIDLNPGNLELLQNYRVANIAYFDVVQEDDPEDAYYTRIDAADGDRRDAALELAEMLLWTWGAHNAEEDEDSLHDGAK